MDRVRIRARLRSKEGYKLKAYRDSLGFWTICIGHLLGSLPIPGEATPAKCDCWLEEDIDSAEAQVIHLPFYTDLDSPRQNVVVELAFNLGRKLLQFKKFLAYMASKDYIRAGGELKASLAYKQEPKRLDELITALATGAYPA